MNDFGKNLKKLRSSINKTQKELASSLGLSSSAIAMYERGEREPDFEKMELIADYFNVSMSSLFGRSSDELYEEYAIQQGLNRKVFEDRFTKFADKLRELDVSAEDLKRVNDLFDILIKQKKR